MKSISKRKRNMHVSLFFLILIVCAEINNVHAILQQHRQKLSDKTSGIVMTSSKEEEKTMDVVPTIVKTKVTNSKPRNSLTGASGASSSKKIAISPTGGATAGAFTGSATGSNSQNSDLNQKKAGMNIDSSDYDNEPKNKVSKIMKVKKSSNGAKQMNSTTSMTNTTLF